MTYFVLLKKEFVEALRTYRLFIIGIVFLLFGFASSIFAKLLPEIIKSLGPGEGMTIQMAEPTVFDSWLQFFSNNGQMTLVLFLITFGVSLSKEINDGTLVLLVTRGVNRNAVMLAKATCQAGIWLIGLFLSFWVTYLYNFLLFSGERQDIAIFALSMIQLGLFGLLFIAAGILGQVLLPKASGGLLLEFVLLVSLLLLNIPSATAKINPLNLMTISADRFNNGLDINHIQGSILVTVLGICVLLFLSSLRFKRVMIR